MRRSRLLATRWLLLFFFIPLAATAADGRHGLILDPPRVVQRHILMNQYATEVPFPSGTGRWQLVVFGYTHCPDVCPMTLHQTSMLLKELGSDSERVRVVFISIDGARDNARAMKEFIGKFDPRILGLTGDAEVLQAVANEFGVLTRRFQGKTALAYTLQHSSFLYLLDPEGRVRMLYPGSTDAQEMAQDLRRLLRETVTQKHQ
jgi:protein SCO1/2